MSIKIFMAIQQCESIVVRQYVLFDGLGKFLNNFRAENSLIQIIEFKFLYMSFLLGLLRQLCFLTPVVNNEVIFMYSAP